MRFLCDTFVIILTSTTARNTVLPTPPKDEGNGKNPLKWLRHNTQPPTAPRRYIVCSQTTPSLCPPFPSPLPFPRRSTGNKNTKLVAPAGNLSAVRGGHAFGGNKKIDDDDRPTALSNGDKTTPSTTAGTAATAATATGKEFDQTEHSRRHTSRPTRGGENHSSSAASSSKRTTSAASAAAPAVVERQRGRDASGGLRELGRAEEEGSPEVVRTKQAATADVKAVATTETYDETAVGTGVSGAAQSTLAAVATTTEGSASGGGTGVVKGTDDAANDSPIYGRWPATLDARWAEVEFMLCHEVDCEESLQYTIEATEAGLVFVDKLEEKAQVGLIFCLCYKYMLKIIHTHEGPKQERNARSNHRYAAPAGGQRTRSCTYYYLSLLRPRPTGVGPAAPAELRCLCMYVHRTTPAPPAS